jgi:hypothetical protein
MLLLSTRLTPFGTVNAIYLDAFGGLLVGNRIHLSRNITMLHIYLLVTFHLMVHRSTTSFQGKNREPTLFSFKSVIYFSESSRQVS